MERSCVILGADITGLSIWRNTQGLIYEEDGITAGGICVSCYIGIDKRNFKIKILNFYTNQYDMIARAAHG